MSINVDINYNIPTYDIFLPMSKHQDINITLQAFNDEQNISISNFPLFMKSFISANYALMQSSIKLNMVTSRLIIDIDPLLMTDIDLLTLSSLDIGQDIMYYSI